jgi:glutathione S-transferase
MLRYSIVHLLSIDSIPTLFIADLPFGVPYLEMDDFKLSQSNSIARFIARKLGETYNSASPW